MPDAPRGLLLCPCAFTGLHVLPREIIPVRSIPGNVFQQLARKSKVISEQYSQELACHFANYLPYFVARYGRMTVQMLPAS